MSTSKVEVQKVNTYKVNLVLGHRYHVSIQSNRIDPKNLDNIQIFVVVFGGTNPKEHCVSSDCTFSKTRDLETLANHFRHPSLLRPSVYPPLLKNRRRGEFWLIGEARERE